MIPTWAIRMKWPDSVSIPLRADSKKPTYPLGIPPSTDRCPVSLRMPCQQNGQARPWESLHPSYRLLPVPQPTDQSGFSVGHPTGGGRFWRRARPFPAEAGPMRTSLLLWWQIPLWRHCQQVKNKTSSGSASHSRYPTGRTKPFHPRMVAILPRGSTLCIDGIV